MLHFVMNILQIINVEMNLITISTLKIYSNERKLNTGK